MVVDLEVRDVMMETISIMTAAHQHAKSSSVEILFFKHPNNAKMAVRPTTMAAPLPAELSFVETASSNQVRNAMIRTWRATTDAQDFVWRNSVEILFSKCQNSVTILIHLTMMDVPLLVYLRSVGILFNRQMKNAMMAIPMI